MIVSYAALMPNLRLCHQTFERNVASDSTTEAEPKELHNAFSVECSPVVLQSVIIV